MIRYLFHRYAWHRVSMPGRGYKWFYYCSTCAKGWDGLFYKAGRSWTSR